MPYIANDRNVFDYQSYTAVVPASLLHSGTNTVTFQQVGANGAGGVGLANVQLETLSSIPYTVPQLPPEPSPIGTWTT